MLRCSHGSKECCPNESCPHKGPHKRIDTCHDNTWCDDKGGQTFRVGCFDDSPQLPPGDVGRNRNFFACDDVSHEGETNTWFTPRNIVEPMGPFDLDPWTQSFRPFDIATRNYCEDQGQDGLSLEWHGRVWLNPPYGRVIGRWLDRLHAHGNGVALVFVRTETRWAQKAMSAATAIKFLSGRISFVRYDGSKSSNAGTGNMLLAYGASNVAAIDRLAGLLYSHDDPTEHKGTL